MTRRQYSLRFKRAPLYLANMFDLSEITILCTIKKRGTHRLQHTLQEAEATISFELLALLTKFLHYAVSGANWNRR